MRKAVRVNGDVSSCCSISDRGLQFGDGVFETMLCLRGAPVNFEDHWTRLTRGCEALGISCPDIREQVLTVVSEYREARTVAKLIVTHGTSERGYRIPQGSRPTWILTLDDAPEIDTARFETGVDVTFCKTRLPLEDARLRGWKHLNRLTQVLARSEWSDEYFDGLLANTTDHIVEGTASNFFFVKQGVLVTSDLSDGGVCGIVRQKVIEHARRNGMDLQVRAVGRHELREPEEAFLTNSVYGVTPIRLLGEVKLTSGLITKHLLASMCRGVYY